MSKVVADDHDATITTNDLALVADLLHAWFYLHDSFSFLQLLTSWPTLIEQLLVAISDPTSCEVIWTQFYDDTILRKDADVVLSHLSRDVCQHNMPIGQLHTEHRIR